MKIECLSQKDRAEKYGICYCKIGKRDICIVSSDMGTWWWCKKCKGIVQWFKEDEIIPFLSKNDIKRLNRTRHAS